MNQATCEPDFYVNEKIQHEFNHLHDAGNDSEIEWRTCAVARASDGTNLLNTSYTGPKIYRKGGSVETQYLVDEKVIYSIIEIKKI